MNSSAQIELPLATLAEAFEDALTQLETLHAQDDRSHEALAKQLDEHLRRWLSAIDLLALAPARSIEQLILPALQGAGPNGPRDPDDDHARLGAALVFLHLDKRRGPSEVLALLEQTSELDARGRRALEQALALWDDPRAHGLAQAGLARASAGARAPWIELMVVRGLDPGAEVLEHALASSVPALQRAALRALPLCTDLDSDEARLAPLLFGEDDDVCLAAVITGLLVGDHKAQLMCGPMSRDPQLPEACELLAGLGSAADCESLRTWVRELPAPAHALWCLGFCGRVSGIEACVEALDHDDAARAQAGLEGFCLATGFVPMSMEATDASASVQARAWWAEHRARFDPTRRYLRGRERGIETIRAELVNGPRRSRDAFARELWVRTGGQVHVWGGAITHVRVAALAKLDDVEIDFEAALLELA